jgi:hypothetical protein
VSSRTRWLLLLAFVVVAASLSVGAVLADGEWQDLWLNLVAETLGAAFIVLFVDRLLERSKEKEREQRRRAAIVDLDYILRELRLWLIRLRQESQPDDPLSPEHVPFDSLVEDLPAYLGRIDFAGSGLHKRDRYFVEWARRTFDQVVIDLARWEQTFAAAAGIFDDDFRHEAEDLRSFVRAASSFLDGMERYILRERPSSPVFAFEGVTELTEDGAKRLVVQLRAFLVSYRGRCERHGVVPDSLSRPCQRARRTRDGPSP